MVATNLKLVLNLQFKRFQMTEILERFVVSNTEVVKKLTFKIFIAIGDFPSKLNKNTIISAKSYTEILFST